MPEEAPRIVKMPSTSAGQAGTDLPLKDRVLVAIGANGSGKSRFGAWLDMQNIVLHHRVSAHRALTFPDRVQPTDLAEAERQLRNGNINDQNQAHHRQHSRWSNSPATALLNDFDALVRVLVSENFSLSDAYRVAMQATSVYQPPPVTKLDQVKSIWESVLPARELVITGSRFETRNRQSAEIYHAREMSDGERGVFYLIAEALSVPMNGVFIVDEPELHLHRAIQARLWDAIEASRPDCTFIYITHDLGFAASRKDATKVWLREFSGGTWDWEVVPDSAELPEALLLEVMGSRRPILFVEGDKSSLDYFIYGRMFPDFTVLPCGSCSDVIYSTKSFNEREALHHHTCRGIIDNDGRVQSDIDALEGKGIHTLPVALIENLFLVEPVLRVALAKLGHNVEEFVAKIKQRVFEALTRNRERVVSNLVRQQIETKLGVIGGSRDGARELEATYRAALYGIAPTALYAEWDTLIGHVIDIKDYEGALRYYKVKGLPAEAGAALGTKYADLVMRWLRSETSAEVVSAMRASIPWAPELDAAVA
jgi:hypothetical protein